MPVFEYEIRPTFEASVEHGEIEAVDEADARRQLRVLYCTPSLPAGTRLVDTAQREAEERDEQSAKLRTLLRVLNAHHQWLLDPAEGARAQLRGRDLSKVSFRGGQLSQAVLAHVDLSGADLVGADLSQADLSGAILVGADLTGADLSQADLSDADLREALLAGARLDGADVWRANFQGCSISPEALHRVLGCRALSTEDEDHMAARTSTTSGM